MKDKVFKALGASNHCKEDRELNDFYASNPNSINELLSVESFDKNIWECAVGQGHLSQRLKEFGYNVFSSDIIDRGYPNTNIINFLENDYEFDGDIITNPPYKFCTEFIIKALNTIKQGHKVAFLLKLQTLEGQKRYEQVFSKQPPRHIYIYILIDNFALKMETLIVKIVQFVSLGLCGKKVSRVNLKLNGYGELNYLW